MYIATYHYDTTNSNNECFNPCSRLCRNTERMPLHSFFNKTFSKTMAAAGVLTADSCSLSDLPIVKSVLSLGGTIINRSRQRGYKYFVQVYEHGICLNLSGQHVIIKAKCYRSMEKKIIKSMK